MARRHDDDAFDENGLLRDGGTARVSMLMKDADAFLVPAVMKDDEGKDVHLESWQRNVLYAHRLGLNDSLDLHRPGPRFCTDAAALEAKEAAYQQMKRELQDAWHPAPAAAASGDDVIRVYTNDREVARRHNTGDAVRDAYLDSVADLTSAWSRNG